MIFGDDENTANDDSLFRRLATERSSTESFEPATDSKSNTSPNGSASQDVKPLGRSCLATAHSSLSAFFLPPDDFHHTEPCQQIGAGWSFRDGKNFLSTSKEDQTSPLEESNIRGDKACKMIGSSGKFKVTLSKFVSPGKSKVQVMSHVETSDHLGAGEKGKVEGNDAIEGERKTTATADNALEEEMMYCDMHCSTQDNDAKNIAETLIELSNTKHTSAAKKRRGDLANTCSANERKLKESAPIVEHSTHLTYIECEIDNETLKQHNTDEYTTEIAETLIGMKKIDSSTVPYEIPTKAVQPCNNHRGSARSEVTWNRRLIELRQFKELHGHTNVPQKYEKNPSLGSWVARNRLFMRQWEEDPNSCSAYQVVRMKALKEIGLVSGIGKGGFGRTTGVFLSSRNARDWENQFQSLQEYRATFGNCNVPVKSETHRSLGRWISAQRRKYHQYISKDTTIKPSNDLLYRFQRLKDIGFNFSIGSGNAKREKVANAIGLSFEILHLPNGSTQDKPNEDGLHRSNAAVKNSIPQSQTK